MNKKRMLDQVQDLRENLIGMNGRVDSLENELKEECKTRIQMSKDIYASLRDNTELRLPVPGMQTLSARGDPLGRNSVKVVHLMLAMLKHIGLRLEYEPGSYLLKKERKKDGKLSKGS